MQRHQTAFALRLHERVASGAGDCNVAISPLSFHSLLSLVAAGANGQTRDQMVSALVGPEGAVADLNNLAAVVVDLVLGDGSATGGPKVSSANGVFVDASMTLKPSYKEIVTGTYKSKAEAVDFRKKATEVANRVNSWVETVTNGLIKELLPPGSVNRDTRLVLVNALYFKGMWQNKFSSYDTRDYDFNLLNGNSIKVPFMTATGNQLASSYNGFKVLRLPYKQGQDGRQQFSMCIFLPDARDGIWSLLERMSSEPEFVSRHLPVEKVEVRECMLPRFKISFGFEASQVLKDMGMVSAFSRADADFSEMVDLPAGGDVPFVTSVHHKCCIDVNESGTEAAAAIGFLRGGGRPSLDAMAFVADHPFIFLVREDQSGVILFAGDVKNPSLSDTILQKKNRKEKRMFFASRIARLLGR